ncbi:MAG: SpoIVB peptidase, partial [Lachnospiraceae bacterium]|nr:SpoIVB peptidase [Lachnospiraceae bacterium]
SVNDSNIPAGSLHLDLQDKFTLKAEAPGSFTINLKLFGFIQFKQISLDVLERLEAIPCGRPIGITLETKGALVLGTGVVASRTEGNIEPAASIIHTGDYITAVNGNAIDGKEELIEAIQKAPRDELLLTVLRSGEEQRVRVRRVQTAAGDYKIGVWVRDDTQGIGTLTYITTDGRFAALGHGISDVDTGVLMEAARGTIYEAEIVAITRGRAGTPGELSGVIRKSESTRLGDIYFNTQRGVFGRLALGNDVVGRLERESKYGVMEIGLRQEVRTGPATILCQVDGELREYTIEIENVDYSNSKQSKGLVIHITDRALINKTGGIVQGMSGSPILQNGKLIGAVTHVFVRDSTRGYGTFIENM